MRLNNAHNEKLITSFFEKKNQMLVTNANVMRVSLITTTLVPIFGNKLFLENAFVTEIQGNCD